MQNIARTNVARTNTVMTFSWSLLMSHLMSFANMANRDEDTFIVLKISNESLVQVSFKDFHMKTSSLFVENYC